MQELLPLDILRVNETGRIVELCGPEELIQRLNELGLSVGTEVRIVKSGQPMLLAVNGHRLSFRADPSTMILVEPLANVS